MTYANNIMTDSTTLTTARPHDTYATPQPCVGGVVPDHDQMTHGRPTMSSPATAARLYVVPTGLVTSDEATPTGHHDDANRRRHRDLTRFLHRAWGCRNTCGGPHTDPQNNQLLGWA